MKKASENGPLKEFVDYTEEELVSSDCCGNAHSCVFDATAGMMLGKRFVKLVAWYDNEWGYSSRVVDLAKFVSMKDGE